MITQDELLQALVQQGLECRTRGAEVQLRLCIFCGNEKWNLELNADRGMYGCWACKAGGRLDKLLHQLTGDRREIPVVRGQTRPQKEQERAPGDFESKPASQVVSAALYLARRDVPADVAEQYGMVVCMDEQHMLYGRLCLPAYDYWSRERLGWVGRSYTGANPKYLSTLPRQAICGWKMRDQLCPVAVVEGLLDAIAVHRAGYSAAALLGVGGAEVRQWAARLHPETRVAVLLDSDAQDTANSLAWAISEVCPGRVVIAQLPPGAKDPAATGPLALTPLLRNAFALIGAGAST